MHCTLTTLVSWHHHLLLMATFKVQGICVCVEFVYTCTCNGVDGWVSAQVCG